MKKETMFKRPSEMKKDEKLTVSTRINSSTKDFLEKEAKKNGLSLSELVSNIVEDYKNWLRGEGK